MSEYNSYGPVSAMGDNAHTTFFVQTTPSQPIDLAELARQLAAVRAEMEKVADSDEPEHDKAIDAIASAEKAAKSGDQAPALGYLKSAGSWALEVAKSAAAGLVKDAIEGKIDI